MLSQALRLLSPPVAISEEQARAAKLLHWITVVGFSLNILDAIILLIFAPETLATFWINGVTLLMTAIAFWLGRRGRVRGGSYVLSLSLWATISYYLLISGGVTSPAMGFLTFVVIVGAVLLETRGAALFGLLCVLTIWLLYWAGNNGWLMLAESPPTPSRLFATHSVIIIGLAVLMTIGARNVHDALARARRHENTLAERNCELELEITEHKLADEALKQSEERFYKAFHANPLAITISTLEEGRFVDVNEGFLNLSGYRREEVIGHTAHELNLWRPVTDRTETIQRLQEEGIIRHMPAELPTRSGSTRFGLTSMEIIELGGELHILSMIQDITEIRQAEQQSLELALAQERAETLKDFLSTISHDLKTPLSVMNTSLYLLERFDDPGKQRDKIQVIRKQTELLEKYIQDILTITRLDHAPELVRQPVILNQLLRDIEQRLRPSIEQKNLTTFLYLGQDVLPVLGDENELDRVLVNLFENAVHYTPSNGSVTVRTWTQNNSAVIEFTDSGIGISESDLPRIFDRFYRANDAQAVSARGTGLGLAIVKKIVELHRGKIEVESVIGKGSTFRVRFPVDE